MNWYRIENKPGNSDLYIYDEINSAKELIGKLDKLNKNLPLNIRVNSPGGSYFDLVALLSYLKTWGGKITGFIDGLAASAASYLLTGCQSVIAYPASLVMIHDVSTGIHGNARQMRELAESLDKISNGLVNGYMAKTGQPEEVVRSWISKDTWLNAFEARDIRLVDEIIEGKVTNSLKFHSVDYSRKRIDLIVKKLNKKFERYL